MKQFITICLALTLSFYAAAQKNNQIKEVKGTEYKPVANDRTYTFPQAVKVGDYYYVTGKKYDLQYRNFLIYGVPYMVNSDFKIFKLDAKMNVKSVVTIPAEFYGKSVTSLTLKRFGDNLCALFYFNNKKQMKQYLFAQMIDLKSFKTLGNPYKIAETGITKKDKRVSSLYQVSITSDYQKMLITSDRTNVWQSRKERKAAATQKNHTFSYWLIDKDFKLLNIGKNVKFGKGNTEVIGQTFDNLGNMCFLGFEEATNTKKKKKMFGDIDSDEESNSSKLVMKIIKPDGVSNDLTFANGEYFYSATLKLNPNTGNVAVIGLLGSGRNGAKGIFSQQVNLATAEVLAENKQEFGVDLVKQIMDLKPPATKEKRATKEKPSKTSKNSKSSSKAAKAIKLDYIHTFVNLGAVHYNDSNELIVVGQKHYTYTVTYTTTTSRGQTTTRTVTYYVYGDIIAFKLDAEGQIVNFGYVFHQYETTSPLDKDYSSLYANDKLYVITKTGGGQVKLDNKASAISAFKESDTYRKRKYMFADFVSVSDNELVHILASKRKVLFSLMSVKLED
jgi:hypothetical protein